MTRGDIVTVSPPGSYGKPRPALVIQSDWLVETDSILVCLLTSTLRDAPLFRLTVEPTPANGLRSISQIMIDKIIAMPRAKCSPPIGRLERDTLATLNRMLALVLGIAD
ncbi:type II toxin-antitoxin system PemK/MazF family toxin [Methylobacterium brachiatum]|uniref:type II toxin-antitoxin system PemK/MazF family toxin n=1 Tax=Methylobacterium brachiatum TaxID=269660 RepID=UPI000EFBFFB7|nr:type II toxin-antitoxin system PemK/MazF family toxin [Methylobacterium brachiatum]AYO82295.1 type II toxin-antitoxin system PemK/MazF family toxin [Methylobacterium brachiatum]